MALARSHPDRAHGGTLVFEGQPCRADTSGPGGLGGLHVGALTVARRAVRGQGTLPSSELKPQ